MYEDEPCADDLVSSLDSFYVDETPRGGFEGRVTVASGYFPVVIGKGGQTKRQLESETKTTVVVPQMGKEGKIGRFGLLRCSCLLVGRG